MNGTHELTPHVQVLIELFGSQKARHQLEGAKDEPRVKIHEAIGKVAYVYEKLRVAIDYQEEHLIRKNAIGRMLKRRINSGEQPGTIAEPLLRELVRAGYLPNNYFPERRLPDIERIIAKYIHLIHHATSHLRFEERKRLMDWIISVGAFEIEEYLAPSIKDDAMVEAMFKIIRPQINLTGEIGADEDQDIQTYIAIHRALIKSDVGMLRYHLVYYYLPEWRYATPAEIPSFAQQLPALMLRIDTQLNNKLSDRLYRYAKKFSPIFVILKDVLEQTEADRERTLSEPKVLDQAIKRACDQRYHLANTKLSRGVVRSIIYIFLTKIILAFILEIPYEYIVLGHLKMLPLAINIVFHPILMFLIATSIRVPAQRNTELITKGIHEVVYETETKEILKKKEEAFHGSQLLGTLFAAVYGIGFVLTFGGLIYVLSVLEFSLMSGFLFVFFLSVISFFGLRLRQTAKELVMLNRREGLFNIIFDFFALPILRAGRWISRKTSKVNIFMFIMDIIIEAPFKILIETVEDWVTYQRQKKEEMM